MTTVEIATVKRPPLSKATNQQILDFVMYRMFKQDRAAIVPNKKQNYESRYRAEVGGKTLCCPVGHLVPPNKYDPIWENNELQSRDTNIQGLREFLRLNGNEDRENLLERLQHAHDIHVDIDGYTGPENFFLSFANLVKADLPKQTPPLRVGFINDLIKAKKAEIRERTMKLKAASKTGTTTTKHKVFEVDVGNLTRMQAELHIQNMMGKLKNRTAKKATK